MSEPAAAIAFFQTGVLGDLGWGEKLKRADYYTASVTRQEFICLARNDDAIGE
jgi:hypothetical protein